MASWEEEETTYIQGGSQNEEIGFYGDLKSHYFGYVCNVLSLKSNVNFLKVEPSKPLALQL